MRKIFILFFFAIHSGINAQWNINAGNDQFVCSDSCTTLSATFLPINQTDVYTVQQVPYLPYSYNTGSTVTTGDDSWSGSVNIGFSFCFFGQTYTQFKIGSNGVISFGPVSGFLQWSIVSGIPASNLPPSSIMCPMHDFGDPPNQMTMRYFTSGTAPNRVCVISWYDAPLYPPWPTYCIGLHATQQIVLHETTNRITINIQNSPACTMWNNGAAIEGIQNANGTAGYTVPGRNYPTVWSATNDSWEFIPAGAPLYSLSWMQDTTLVSNSPVVTVCPSQSSDYVLEVNYSPCTGLPVSASDTVRVNIGGTPAILTVSNDTTICSGDSVRLFATSNIPSSAFAWNPVLNISTVNTDTIIAWPTASTTYSVTATDSFCQVRDSIRISVDHLSLAISQVPASCYHSCDAQATATASNGLSPYLFSWTPGNFNTSQIQTCAGNYSVNVFDSIWCTVSGSVLLTEPQRMLLTDLQDTFICPGDSVLLQAVSADSNAVFNWSPASGLSDSAILTPMVSPAQTTTYILTAYDGNCYDHDTLMVAADLSGILNTVSYPVLCNSSCNGSATVNVTGNGPFLFSWNPGNQNTQTANSLCNGNYYVTVTDSFGCMFTDSAFISEPAVLTNNATAYYDTLYPGVFDTLYAYASGGTSPYNFSWQWSTGNSSGDTLIVQPLLTTSYTLTTTDSNGCTSVTNITVFVDVTTGTLVQDGTHWAQLYPNPADNKVFILFDKEQKTGGTISIYDLNGKAVQIASYNPGQSLVAVPLSGFENGIYQVDIRSASGDRFVQRIVIKH